MSTSTERKAFKGATWLGGFKAISQTFSWATTIIVAKMLMPADYGLMAMATVITGYIMLFSELGLGGAIIHRASPTKSELSSVFWLTAIISMLFGVSCLFIAYPTAWLFNEPRVIPLTQAVSILFILIGLQIVPMNLLKKDLKFKIVGMIEAISTVTSCLFMASAAYLGAGVWTLIGGSIVKALVSIILIFSIQQWRPSLMFRIQEALSYLNYGYHLALGTSIGYVNNKSDTFFAGRVWETSTLGLYSFAKQLSRIPNDKIVSLITQVAFPAFSQLQDDTKRFNTFYLDITKVISTIVLPLFVGGFLLGDELIRCIFDEKWHPMIFVFKILCLTELATPLSTINSMVHGAQGRPHWFLRFNVFMLCFLPISFFIAAPYGLTIMVVPWFTTYLLICSVWQYITIKKIGITVQQFFSNLKTPIGATISMSLCVLGYENLNRHLLQGIIKSDILNLSIKIAIGAGIYLGYFLMFDKKFLRTIKKIIR